MGRQKLIKKITILSFTFEGEDKGFLLVTIQRSIEEDPVKRKGLMNNNEYY